jgi:hypothetical protein
MIRPSSGLGTTKIRLVIVKADIELISTLQHIHTARNAEKAWELLCRCYVRNGGAMSAVPTNVGVFFGQVNTRAKGWYWADTQSEKLMGAIQRPFETKEQAVEDALQTLREATNETSGRGAA